MSQKLYRTISADGRHTKLYGVYCNMKQRCNNPKCPTYQWYGAKGVAVCAEWQSYCSFAEWALSNGYQEGLSIDRIDPKDGYSPSNCRWITRSENSSRVDHHGNKNRAIYITISGETHTIVEWAGIAGLHPSSISRAKRIYGVSAKQFIEQHLSGNRYMLHALEVTA